MGLFGKIKAVLKKTREGLASGLSALFSKNKLGEEFLLCALPNSTHFQSVSNLKIRFHRLRLVLGLDRQTFGIKTYNVQLFYPKISD